MSTGTGVGATSKSTGPPHRARNKVACIRRFSNHAQPIQSMVHSKLHCSESGWHARSRSQENRTSQGHRKLDKSFELIISAT